MRLMNLGFVYMNSGQDLQFLTLQLRLKKTVGLQEVTWGLVETLRLENGFKDLKFRTRT